MPPKKNPTGEESEEASSNISMTAEQFSQLLSALRDVSVQNVNEIQRSMQPATPQLLLSSGSFARCTARFSGSDTSDVDAFLDNIKTYKDICNVSDDNALRGISMLLEGQASKWWLGVKSTITTWNDAIVSLTEAFSRKLPPHLVFREIFSREQAVDETTEVFVCRIRALMSQLPYVLRTEAQLDMVFGLLFRKIRKRLIRSEITDFSELLTRARDIERSLQDSSDKQTVSKPKDSDNQKLRSRCVFCKNFGHTKDECLKLQKKQEHPVTKASPVSEEPSGTTRPHLTCYGCGAPGVIRSKCPTCKAQNRSSTTLQANYFSFFNTSVENKTNKPLIPIEIKGILGVGIVDCGADKSIAGVTLYQTLKDLGYDFESSETTIRFADGEPKLTKVLTTQVDVSIKNKVVPISFTVLPHLKSNYTLLGRDFIQKANIVLNLPQNHWYFCDSTDEKFNFVNDSILPTSFQAVEVDGFCLRPEEGAQLNESDRSVLIQLLAANTDVFEPKREPTTLAVHRINTSNHSPVSSHPYPLSVPKKEFLRKELDQLLEEGVMEECESPWSSPVVLVPKKDNSFRLGVDYRRLNNVTVGDTYQVPPIDELFQSAKSTPYMSTIDLQSGYWQGAVEEPDRNKTCFTTQFDTYRFNRMPFGLKNAPATFTRLMNRFRVLLNNCLNYIQDLKAVLIRLRECNLSARREKCYFVCGSVKYLGQIITTSCIKTDRDNLSAIKYMHPPRKKKKVQSFVQTYLWSRKFVPNFYSIARPLTDLSKKNKYFDFSELEFHSFEMLKQTLTGAPVLIQENPSKPYLFSTNDSDFVLGEVLLQGEGLNARRIEFGSHLLIYENCSKVLIEEMILRFDTLFNFRKVVENDNFVPCFTPYLRKLSKAIEQSKETIVKEQDKWMERTGQRKRSVNFQPGQKVLKFLSFTVLLVTKKKRGRPKTTPTLSCTTPVDRDRGPEGESVKGTIRQPRKLNL